MGAKDAKDGPRTRLRVGVGLVALMVLLVVSLVLGAISCSLGRASRIDAGIEDGSPAARADPTGSRPVDLLPDPGELGWDGGGGPSPVTQVERSSDDDGELHDGLDASVSYGVVEEHYSLSGLRRSDAYDMDVQCDFDVTYPQLTDGGEHTDEVNALLRDTAMTFLDRYWNDPSSEDVAAVRSVASASTLGVPEGADMLLMDDVSWAVTYNTEDFVSVSFADHCCLASYVGEHIQLRTVNVNLRTGETYAFDDVLTMDEAMAARFVDNLVQSTGTDANHGGTINEDESPSVSIIGRDEWISALMGEGPSAGHISKTVFVDERGRANLGVSYWLSDGRSFSRGWWDVTLDATELAAQRKDSSFWDLLPEVEGTEATVGGPIAQS